MPVSLRLLDATGAGAQTARLLAALVCSVSVTTAVTAPMAYQAVEFRRAGATVVAEAPAATPIRDTAATTAAPAATPAAGPSVAVPATTTTTTAASTSTTTAPAETSGTGTEPVSSPATAPAAGVAPATTIVVVTTLKPVADLSEFNPHPSCDDKAQELNVGSRPACPPPTTTG